MSLPSPPHPLLEEILRTVARRYRLPPMTVTSADIKNVNPATTLPIVIEQARQAVADGQAPDPALKRRFIEALAHMIRDAMRAAVNVIAHPARRQRLPKILNLFGINCWSRPDGAPCCVSTRRCAKCVS